MNFNTIKPSLKLLAAVFVCVALALSATSVAAELEQPKRSIGYFIGDILVQRITLDADDGRVVMADLESGQRIDEYLYRLPVVQPSERSWINGQLQQLRRAWGAIADGSDSGETTVDLRYQVINVPPVLRPISLPEMTLATDSGSRIEIPGWQFTIGPLSQGAISSNSADSGDLIEKPTLLPDRSAAQLLGTKDSRKYRARLTALLFLLIATGLLWLAWWLFRQYNDKRVLPFARARQSIRKLPRSQRQSDDMAWRILHAAFNETAGKTTGAGTVTELLQHAPWLQTLDDEINHFYRASAERFFQQSDTARTVNIESFAQLLFQLEKRQSRSSLATATQGAVAKSGTDQTLDSQSKPLSD